MSIDKSELQGLAGAAVIGPDGEKIGDVSQFYLSDTTGEPTWATVKTGLFGNQESFVPLSGASAQSGELRVAFDKATVKDAPRVDTDGHLTPEEEDDLYGYYRQTDDDGGMRGGTEKSDAFEQRTGGETDSGAEDDRATHDAGDAGVGTRGDSHVTRGDADAGLGGTTTGSLGSQARAGNREDAEHDMESSRRDARSRVNEESDDSAADRDNALDAVTPGETRTRMRRYVVTEHVTQTVEELPEDDETAGPATG